ncbi:hypothetical protein KI387_014868, partial [Taxus chinensis]
TLREDKGDYDAKGTLGVGAKESIGDKGDGTSITTVGLALELSLGDEVVDGDTSIEEDEVRYVDEVIGGDEM